MASKKISRLVPSKQVAVVPGKSKLTQMTYFSSDFFKLGYQMALQAPTAGRPMVSAAVILSATALEAFLSERIELAKVHDVGFRQVAGTLLEMNGLSLDQAWILFQHMLSGKTFDRGAEPFQSFMGLVNLRNVLVHRASRFLEYDDFPNKRIKDLENKFAFTRTPRPFGWDVAVLNADCARWACMTASAMHDSHYDVVGTSDKKGSWGRMMQAMDDAFVGLPDRP